MARLNHEQKVFAVTCLARTGSFETTLAALKEQFGGAPELAGLTAQHLEVYAPYTKAGARLSDELADLFWQERAKVTGRLDRIRIASVEERLLHLDRMVFDPDPDAPPLTMKMVLMAFAHAAKERGGMFNARESAGTPAEIAAYVNGMGQKLKEAVDAHVTDPEQREAVHATVRTLLEEEGEGGGP